MTLEVLFAAAGQRRTFLLMGLLGAALALLVHLGGGDSGGFGVHIRVLHRMGKLAHNNIF